MASILAVDDEPDALGTITRVLQDVDHHVVTANSGASALQQLKEIQPDLMILDIIMPDMTGIDVCKRVRIDPFTARLPIIFLTAKGRPEDIKAGLDAGGDDYIIKPFQVIELPARINALLRRSPGGVLDSESDYLKVGSLQLHRRKLKLQIDEETYDLTIIQHRILHHLMTCAGQPQSVEELLENVWSYPAGIGDPDLVYAHIRNLRKLIEPSPDTPAYILSLRGQGYIISS